MTPTESKRRRTIFLHARQYRAALPQQQSRSVVPCRHDGVVGRHL